MELQYFGLSCFRFHSKGVSIVTDPYNTKDVGISYPILEADAVIYTDKGDEKKVKPSDERRNKSLDLVEIRGAGEYEVGGIFITSFDSVPFFVISTRDINVCYLGMLKGEISRDLFENIGDIDYLIVPVGDGKDFVDWKDLEKVVSEVDPCVLIPSCYYIDGMKNHWKDLKKADEFTREFGFSNPEKEMKLKLKHFVDADSKQLNTILLEPKIK